jgi:hypothetical protein
MSLLLRRRVPGAVGEWRWRWFDVGQLTDVQVAWSGMLFCREENVNSACSGDSGEHDLASG